MVRQNIQENIRRARERQTQEAPRQAPRQQPGDFWGVWNLAGESLELMGRDAFNLV